MTRVSPALADRIVDQAFELAPCELDDVSMAQTADLDVLIVRRGDGSGRVSIFQEVEGLSGRTVLVRAFAAEWHPAGPVEVTFWRSGRWHHPLSVLRGRPGV